MEITQRQVKLFRRALKRLHAFWASIEDLEKSLGADLISAHEFEESCGFLFENEIDAQVVENFLESQNRTVRTVGPFGHVEFELPIREAIHVDA